MKRAPRSTARSVSIRVACCRSRGSASSARRLPPASLETGPRGIYCGAIGLRKPGGDAIFNVAIRTLALDGITGRAEYGVGSGITADSVAHDEYEEMRAKARILRCAA